MKREEWSEFVPVNHPDIGRILGRVHCMSTHRECIREVLSKSKTPWKEMPKHMRRYLIAACIQHHMEDRDVFVDVMSGHFREERKPRYWFRASDKRVEIREY